MNMPPTPNMGVKKKPVWPWVVGGCGCLLVAVIAFGVAIFLAVIKMTEEPEAVAREFVDLISTSEYGDAYELFSDELRLEQDYEAFHQMMLDNSYILQIIDMSFTSRNRDNSDVTFAGSVTLVSGEELDVEFGLVKVGENWKIYRYSIAAPSQP